MDLETLRLEMKGDIKDGMDKVESTLSGKIDSVTTYLGEIVSELKTITINHSSEISALNVDMHILKNKHKPSDNCLSVIEHRIDEKIEANNQILTNKHTEFHKKDTREKVSLIGAIFKILVSISALYGVLSAISLAIKGVLNVG